LAVLCEPFAPGSDACERDPSRATTGCNNERRTTLLYNHPDFTLLVVRERVEARLLDAAGERRAHEAQGAGRRPRGPQATTGLRRTLKASLSRSQV
jgi:hypothetical protein